jgi:hypothetical protein
MSYSYTTYLSYLNKENYRVIQHNNKKSEHERDGYIYKATNALCSLCLDTKSVHTPCKLCYSSGIQTSSDREIVRTCMKCPIKKYTIELSHEMTNQEFNNYDHLQFVKKHVILKTCSSCSILNDLLDKTNNFKDDLIYITDNENINRIPETTLKTIKKGKLIDYPGYFERLKHVFDYCWILLPTDDLLKYTKITVENICEEKEFRPENVILMRIDMAFMPINPHELYKELCSNQNIGKNRIKTITIDKCSCIPIDSYMYQCTCENGGFYGTKLYSLKCDNCDGYGYFNTHYNCVAC